MRDDPGRPGDDGARRGRPPILLLAVNWVVSSVLLAGMSDTLRAPTPAAHARGGPGDLTIRLVPAGVAVGGGRDWTT